MAPHTVRFLHTTRRSLIAFTLAFGLIASGLSFGGGPLAGLALSVIYALLLLPAVAIGLSYVELRPDEFEVRNFVRRHVVSKSEVDSFELASGGFVDTGLVRLRDGRRLRLRAIDAGNGLSKRMRAIAEGRLDELRRWAGA